MDVTATTQAAPEDEAAGDPGIGSTQGNDLCFVVGITPNDLSVVPSDDGQHLLICCRDRMVAIITSMGCSVEMFRFADGQECTAEDLLTWL